MALNGGKRTGAGRKSKAVELGLVDARAALAKYLGVPGATLKTVDAYKARLHRAFMDGRLDNVTFRDLGKAAKEHRDGLARDLELAERVQARKDLHERSLRGAEELAQYEQLLAAARALKAAKHGAESAREDQAGAGDAPEADQPAGPDVGTPEGLAQGSERESSPGRAPAKVVRRAV
jgi:hypothetical protein